MLRNAKRLKGKMGIIKQAAGIALIALVVGMSVNFLRSESLPMFVSQDSDSTQGKHIEQISIEKARAILKTGRAFFLDVRSAEAFAKSHFSGALNFPAKEIYGLLARIDQRIPKDAEVILYGVDKKDIGPAEVASLLQMMGYGNVKIVAEGWEATKLGS
jgi:rhodanese-related sulfurtransferase